jgi:hypothetical protein
MLPPNYDDDYDDDSGYDTDATILNEDYDSETEGAFNADETERASNANNRKRKMSTPSTPEPMMQGPEPPTVLVMKNGGPMFTRINGELVPFTSNSSNNGEIPLDRYGEPIKRDDLPPSIKRRLFEGGMAKSRRRRRPAKKSSRKRSSRRTRKSAHKRRARSTRSKH